MSLFLDGLILFCIAFCVIAGVKNGFVRSVMGICKGAVSLIVDGDLGYPATVELSDGSLFTVYYQRVPGDRQDSILYTRWEL